jgi:hypothetical protein
LVKNDAAERLRRLPLMSIRAIQMSPKHKLRAAVGRYESSRERVVSAGDRV